jgi:hypothetical protein
MFSLKEKKSKAILVIGRGGLQGCEILRLPHYIDNRITDAVRLSALRTGQALLPRNIISLLLVLISEAEKTLRPNAAGRVR